MKNIVKWGILGTSFISEVMADAMLASESSQLVAIASRSQEKSAAFAKNFSIEKSFDNYETLLNDPEIDAVYIGLPNHMHKEWTVRCAEAGKHILCEKPFALNAAEVEDAFSVVENAGVHCIEGLMYRFHPFTQKLEELVKQKAIGDITLIHAMYSANIAQLANPVAGGAIRNLGCYPVSLIRLLMGKEPVGIQGSGRMDADNQNDNQASVILSFDQHEMAVVSTADDIDMYWQFDVFGKEGMMQVVTNPWMPDLENNSLVLHRKDQDMEEINVTANKPLYTYQIDALNERILSSSFSIELHQASKRDSLANIAVLDAWIKSVYPKSKSKHSAGLLQVS